jgi:hypothetical protein
MSFDIKLYEYAWGNDYETSDSHKSIYDVSLNFTTKVIKYELTPMNNIENYTFKVPNTNGLLYKGMSYGDGSISVDYLITKGTGTSIEQNVSDFIYYYLGYYSQQNGNNKFGKKLVLVNTEDYATQGHLVILNDVGTSVLDNNQAVVSATFTKLQPYMMSRVMYTNSSSKSSGDTITLSTSYLSTLDTPLYIILTFTASCSNPVITAEDNTYIRLAEDFTAGDVVIINGEDKTITINGLNGLYALDYSSNFLTASDNNNDFTFTTTSGGASTGISINWYNRWIA